MNNPFKLFDDPCNNTCSFDEHLGTEPDHIPNSPFLKRSVIGCLILIIIFCLIKGIIYAYS